ncbi:TPA: SAVED domain-containing protein [Escherichia coli]|nr:SAVED domain-containing protein [Escherichia coli]ELG8273488.1 SAVED domain-containing protein [Escherichia coli]EMD3346479.1 SAVED domain-containing protein [Escherichia coli]HAV8880626.1 SAVED domain-containing protein [Escherichia coli]HAW1374359.1 SAVED domain-containing protein [Escherichia coli]
MYMSNYWKHQFSKVLDYLTRQKKPAIVLMTVGATILGGQKALNFAVTGNFSWGSLTVGTNDGNVINDYLVPIVAIMLIVMGGILMALHEFQAFKQNSRKRIVLVAGNGLRTTSETGLDKKVTSILKGTIYPVEIDITQQFRDGYVFEPELTFMRKILPTKDNLAQLLAKGSADTTQVVYGGFLPVPFTFFIGNVLDDKSDVGVFDWDRENERWVHISETHIDDGESFISETIRTGELDEVVLVVSCSYRVKILQVGECFKGLGIEHLTLKTIAFDNHWSLVKQRRLSIQFAEKIKSLSDMGIKTIHLILAAQSSVVLNLGRRYDSRNMSELIVYQYEQTNKNPYPWGIYALSHGHENSGFITRSEEQ